MEATVYGWAGATKKFALEQVTASTRAASL